MKTRFALLLTLLCCGCQWNIDWTGQHHVQPDPNPPHVVTQPEFRLLIVEETADRPSLAPSQLSIFTSTSVRDYLDQHCKQLADGSNGYRIVDKDQISELPDDFRATVKPENPTPWLYCTDGTNGLSCPLPSSPDELLAKVRPYAEGK